MHKKIIIVVNGQGGAGKDAFCDAVTQNISCKTVSSIDVIKRIARKGGWKGEKTDPARRLLSDLKLAFSAYNDLPFEEMMLKVKRFVSTNTHRILFVHIREPKEIEKFKKAASELCSCITLLITRPQIERNFGNMADDNVKNYPYDFTFVNDYENLQLLSESAVIFVRRILESQKNSLFPK
jgi:hypothetical protein